MSQRKKELVKSRQIKDKEEILLHYEASDISNLFRKFPIFIK